MVITNALALLLMRSLKPHKKVFTLSVMRQNMRVGDLIAVGMGEALSRYQPKLSIYWSRR